MGGYSAEFQDLITDKIAVSKLMEGSSFHDAPFEDWKDQRHFISQAINKNGTILDVGCGNGFLLKCLAEWSGHELIPYGMDIKPDYIRQAKELFPDHRANFKIVNFYTGMPELSLGMQLWFFKKFDFLIWSVWDNYHFKEKGIRSLRNLYKRVKRGGRMILTFYDPHPGSNISKINFLRQMGYKLTEVQNHTGNEAMVIIEK